MPCGICGGPVTGTVRTDPKHADCVLAAETRMRAGMCAACGERPVERDGRCMVCAG